MKSKVGLTATETLCQVAFCTYAILQSEPFIVSDASTDERFADHPWVTGEPHIWFYAGVPIITSSECAWGSCAGSIRFRDRSLKSSIVALKALDQQ